MLTPWILFLAFGATARLTRLVTDDVIAQPFRIWVVTRWGGHSKIATLITCPWCLGLWIAGAVIATQQVAAYHGWHQWFTVPAAILTITWAYGIAASWLDGPPAPVPETDLLAKALTHVRTAGDEQLAARITTALAEASK